MFDLRARKVAISALQRVRPWLLVVVVLQAACAEQIDERIRFGLPTAPVTLDPRFATDAVSNRLVRLLHRPLVDFNEQAEPVANLANWQRLTPTRYRFRINADASFNSGRAVTATDVAATYRSILDPATASPHRESLANIAAIMVLDPHAIEFELSEPDVLFPGTLVIGVMAAEDVAAGLPRDAWHESSGAFERLGWGVDGRLLLRRRHDHALFEFVPVKDVTVRALKLIGGELDIVQGNIPPEIFRWLSMHPALHGERVAGTTFSYIGFNLSHGPTSRRDVRLAIAHAIDREAIVRHVFDGTARTAAAIFPPEHWAGADDLSPPLYDPARALQIIRAAGYADQRIGLTYKTSSDHFRLRIATILQSQLAAVGIDVKIESLDWGTFYGDIRNGNFQLYGLSWVGLKLPDIFRYAFHSESLPPAGANRGRYESASADQLIEAAEAEPERNPRQAVYRALEQRLLYDLPYIPLWFEDQLTVSRNDIVGYTTNADGHFDALVQTNRRAAVESR